MNELVRILVVDDNPDILRGTARLMEQAGYTVDRAASGEEALLTAQSHRPDLLLLDHDLPGINGTEVCRQIKQDPALADTLVIIVSALHAESDQQAEGLELGADGYIGRPIGNRELLARVQAYVRIQRLTRSLHLHAEELQQSKEAATQAHLATRRLMADAVAARDRLEIANQALQSENTARKLAEAAREEALSRLEKIASRVPGVVYQFRLRPDGTTSMPYASDGFREIYRLSPEAVRDDAAPAFACHHPDDQAGILASIQQSAQNLTPWRHEFRVRFADGTVRWLAGNALSQRETDGTTLWHGFITDITARRQAEAALREKDIQFRSLFEQAGQGILIVGREGRIVEANQTAAAMHGFTSDEFTNMGLTDLDTPESAALMPERMRRIFAGETLHFEVTRRHKDGHIFPMAITASLFTYAGVSYVIGFFADITARRQAEEKLRESERRHRRLFDQANEGVIIMSLDGNLSEINRAFAEMHGYTVDELKNVDIRRLDVLNEQTLADRTDLLRRIQAGEVVRFEVEHYHKAGHSFPLSVSTSLIDLGGQSFYLASHQDNTARQQAAAVLRESETKFRLLAENIQDVFWISTPAIDKLLYVSPAFERIWGRTCASLYQHPQSFAEAIHAEDRDRVNAALQEHAQGNWSVEYRILRPDGSVRWIQDRGFPIRDERGALSLMCGVAADITARRQAEVALRESHGMIVKLTSQVPGVVYQYRLYPDGRSAFPFASPGMNDIYEVTPEEVREDATPVFGRLHPEDYDRIVADIQESARTLQLFHCEFRVVLPRQGLRWRLCDASPERMEDGGTLWHGIISDITARRQAEAALRESEGRLRSVIDCTPVPLAINDEQGNITYVNREFTKTFGYELGDIPTLAAWWQKAYPDPTYQAEAKTQWQLRLNQALQEGTAFEPVEVNIRCQNGAQRIAMVGAAALPGTFAGTHLVVLYDITERKQMEAANTRLATAVEQAGETIVITDTSGTILYANPAFEQTSGYTRAEAIGQNPRLLKSGQQDVEFYRQMWEVLKRGQVWHGHFSNKRKDGKLYEEEATISPVRDATGTIVNYVAVKRDVTRELELEAQFRQAQKLEAIGQLAGGIAHDFNNILAAILGNAQLAVADMDPSLPARESLEEIMKAGIRAKGLVQQILTFSRQQPQHRQVISLEPIIAEAAKFLHATIPSGVEIVLELAASAPPVLADATQIHQVIFNLCTNAWHALEDRPGRIDIQLQPVTLDAVAAERLAGLRPGRFACLSISDTGKGMDAATIEHIFNPFFTTKAPGKGTGLGLSVVQGIVAAHDGAITVVSQPGQGTTFQVYFPAASAGTAGSEIEPEGPVHHGQGQHVLFLDDEESLVFLATRTLEWLGYRATGFTEAADAVQAFRANPGQFDVVVTDLNMPGASGLGVARELLTVRPDVPVLLCSGHVTEQMTAQAHREGIHHVLHKPTTMEELSATLHRLFTHPRPPGPKL